MIIRVKQGYDEIKLNVGNFESAIALAESLMLYSSTNDLWLKLEEDPEPEKEEGKEEAPESKDETNEADSEATSNTSDDSTTEETEQESTASKRPPLTKSQIGRIYALDDAGWSASKIADEVGCSISTVYNYMNKNLRSK